MKYTTIIILFVSYSAFCQTQWKKVITYDPVDIEKIVVAEKSLSELLDIIDKHYKISASKSEEKPCIYGDCNDSNSGVLHYPNHYSYKGSFKRHSKYFNTTYHGYGCLLKSDNSFYLGEFKDGAKNGFGILIYSPQYYYIGNWKDDYWDGAGKRVHFGEIKEGIWKAGLYVQPLNDCAITKSFSYLIPTYITKSNALNFKVILTNHKPGVKDFEAIFHPESADILWTKYTKNITTLVLSDLVGYDMNNYDLQCLTLEDIVKNWKLNNLKFKNNSLQLLKVTFYRRSIGGGELNLYFFKSIESEKIVLIDLVALNSMK